MEKVSGSVEISGSVVYVSQQAWIQNAKLKDNILFGAAYDEARYGAVLDACARANVPEAARAVQLHKRLRELGRVPPEEEEAAPRSRASTAGPAPSSGEAALASASAAASAARTPAKSAASNS